MDPFPKSFFISRSEQLFSSGFAFLLSLVPVHLFLERKKEKKCEKTAVEIALLVEEVMAELTFAAREDALLNVESKLAINKLIKLPFLTQVLSKKQLQQEFLDHGILVVLKSWIKPLPDGSLPNINIRAAILKILIDFPLDLDQCERKEQLKKRGLGEVIRFLLRSDEETTSNRKVAKELVDNWDITDEPVKWPELGRSTKQPFYSFLPPASALNGLSAGTANSNGEQAEAVDLNLKPGQCLALSLHMSGA